MGVSNKWVMAVKLLVELYVSLNKECLSTGRTSIHVMRDKVENFLDAEVGDDWRPNPLKSLKG